MGNGGWRRRFGHLGWLLIASMIAMSGCAPELTRTATSYAPLATVEKATVIRVDREEIVEYGSIYTRSIAAGSEWIQVGRVNEGDVFRRLNGVFTVEGAHIHEAALVLRGKTLVGFYLLAEASFVAISAPMALQYSETR